MLQDSRSHINLLGSASTCPVLSLLLHICMHLKLCINVSAAEQREAFCLQHRAKHLSGATRASEILAQTCIYAPRPEPNPLRGSRPGARGGCVLHNVTTAVRPSQCQITSSARQARRTRADCFLQRNKCFDMCCVM